MLRLWKDKIMRLKNRVEKLEAQNGADRGVKVIISAIHWAGQEKPISYLGQALTPTGWKTASSDGEETEDEFEKRLLAMVEG